MKILSKKDCAKTVGGQLQYVVCFARYRDSNEGLIIFSFYKLQGNFSYIASRCRQQACNEKKIQFSVLQATDNRTQLIEKNMCTNNVSPLSWQQIISNEHTIFDYLDYSDSI